MQQFKREPIEQTVYLTYAMEPEEFLDRMALGMMEHNSIDGLLEVRYLHLDALRLLRYEIGDRKTLAEALRGEVKGFRPLQFWKSLAEIIGGTKEYMLREQAFVFEPERIFLQDEAHALLLYLPIERSDGISFRQLCVNLLEQPELAQSIGYGALSMIQKYLQEEVFSAKIFAQILGKAELASAVCYSDGSVHQDAVVFSRSQRVEPGAVVHGAATRKRETTPEPEKRAQPLGEQTPAREGKIILARGYASNTEEHATGRYSEAAGHTAFLGGKDHSVSEQPDSGTEGAVVLTGRTSAPAEKAPETPSGLGSTVFLNGEQHSVSEASSGRAVIMKEFSAAEQNEALTQDASEAGTQLLEEAETVVLTPEKPRAFLRRLSTGETIEVTGETFCIGRSRRDNDYRVDDNPAVSRWHAQIFYRSGHYFVSDCSSKNLTYLDGSRVERDKEAKLNDGMRLRLADEEFLFTIQK